MGADRVREVFVNRRQFRQPHGAWSHERLSEDDASLIEKAPVLEALEEAIEVLDVAVVDEPECADALSTLMDLRTRLGADEEGQVCRDAVAVTRTAYVGRSRWWVGKQREIVDMCKRRGPTLQVVVGVGWVDILGSDGQVIERHVHARSMEKVIGLRFDKVVLAPEDCFNNQHRRVVEYLAARVPSNAWAWEG